MILQKKLRNDQKGTKRVRKKQYPGSQGKGVSSLGKINIIKSLSRVKKEEDRAKAIRFTSEEIEGS